MKKLLRIIGLVLLSLILVAAFLLYRWTLTPYGSLDYKVAIGLKLYEPPDIIHFTPQELREKFAEEDAWFQEDEYIRQIPSIKDTVCRTAKGNIPVRIYRPDSLTPLPILVYYHGGGFVFGTLDEYNGVCARLAHHIPAIVVSVDYRLAPENPYPVPVEDAYAALQWVYQQAALLKGDSTRLAVAGDSAGGNLAAVVSHMARDLGGPAIVCQVLYYPATQAVDFNTESHQKYGQGFALTTERVRWYTDQYLPDWKDRYEGYASPLLAKNFDYLPPALVIIAGFDPLRSEGEAYAEKLQLAGVPVQQVLFPDVIHGFINVPFFDQSQEALTHTIKVLQQHFHQPAHTSIQ